MPVVPTLSLGKHRVHLHSDQGNLTRVPDRGSDPSGPDSADGLLQEPRDSVELPFLRLLGKDIEEPQPPATVDDLSYEAGAQALAEGADPFFVHYGRGDDDRRGGAPRSGAHLDPHLHHVHGLDATNGEHAAHSAGDEGLKPLPHISHDEATINFNVYSDESSLAQVPQ